MLRLFDVVAGIFSYWTTDTLQGTMANVLASGAREHPWRQWRRLENFFKTGP